MTAHERLKEDVDALRQVVEAQADVIEHLLKGHAESNIRIRFMMSKIRLKVKPSIGSLTMMDENLTMEQLYERERPKFIAALQQAYEEAQDAAAKALAAQAEGETPALDHASEPEPKASPFTIVR